MAHIQEYKKQGIYISLGLLVLLFPFFDTSYLLLAFIVGGLFFSRLSSGSYVFSVLARESDIKEGKLTSLIQLFFIMALLLLVSLLIGQPKLPLFIIGGAFVITTFGDGISDIINIHDKAKNDKKENNTKIYSAKSSIVFLISGGIFAFLAEVWILEWSQTVYYPFPYGMLFSLPCSGLSAVRSLNR